MTAKTKTYIGLALLLTVSSIVAYKMYENNKAKKMFAKKTDENKSEASGFGREIVEQYKNPLWVM